VVVAYERLTPFQEQKLTLLLRQGYDVDALLRRMGAEIRLEHAGPGNITPAAMSVSISLR
jgi:hypothetical protein